MLNYINKLILTIDIDAFFAQAEEKRNPKYKGLPICIGNELNGRGVVSTANYISRALGIKSGMPLFKARKICPNLILVEADHEYYLEKANEVFDVIMKYSDKVQVASIDECYVDATKLTNKYKPIEIAKVIQRDIFIKTGLTTSVGISTNILLSKMASNLDKPMGITTLYKHEIPKKLWSLPIKDMYMIGEKTSEKLIARGINTIGDLATIKDSQEKYNEIKSLVGLNIDKHIDASNGDSTDIVVIEEKELKSISKDKTFEYSIKDIDTLLSKARVLFDFALYRCKRRKFMPSSISVGIKLDKHLNKISNSKKLKYPTIDSEILWPIAIISLEKLFKETMSVRFVSISLEGLKPLERNYQQLELSEIELNNNKTDLQKIVDEINITSNVEVFTGKKMENNIKYENKDPVMWDNVKFKAWDK